MSYLESLLFQRASIIWSDRDLPDVSWLWHLTVLSVVVNANHQQYLGPSVGQILHIVVLIAVNSLTDFILFILLLRTLWTLGSNVTTIESWEIERHKTLVRRARKYGGYLEGPGGVMVRIDKQEFPYDIGIWSNIKAGMGGTGNVRSFDPFYGFFFLIFSGPCLVLAVSSNA